MAEELTFGVRKEDVMLRQMFAESVIEKDFLDLLKKDPSLFHQTLELALNRNWLKPERLAEALGVSESDTRKWFKTNAEEQSTPNGPTRIAAFQKVSELIQKDIIRQNSDPSPEVLAERLVQKHNEKTASISRIPDMAAKIFTVAQQKGGAGKTTLAVHLALALRTRNRAVAVVDIDPQQSLGQWFQHRAARLDGEDSGLTVTSVQGWRTQAEVQKLARYNDVVIIDSPPHAETEARVAIRLANLVIVPVQPSPMDVWASQATLDLAAGEKKPALLVLNRVPPRSRLTEEMLAEIAETNCQLATTRIGNRVAFASALAAGQGVTEAQPRSRAAEEIKCLAKEIMRRAGIVTLTSYGVKGGSSSLECA